MRDDITKAEMEQRAALCWSLMDDNERAAVRFGLLPSWTAEENLGGRAASAALCNKLIGDEHRLFAVAVMAYRQG